LAALQLTAWLGACQAVEHGTVGDTGTHASPIGQEASPSADAGTGDAGWSDGGAPPQLAEQAPIPEDRAALCARPRDDAVRDIFCKGSNLNVSSLRELAIRLGISVLPVDMDEATAAQITLEPTARVPHAVLLGHSTALSGQLVSPINPRAILLNDATLIAFQRGVQKVEIVTAERGTKRPNLYLLTFKQACNVQPSGCTPGNLYTLGVERDWTSVVLQDDEDLKNTPLDCRQCHQRNRETPVLLMRELQAPWLHFFFFDNELSAAANGNLLRGRALVQDYLSAKGAESYAGLAAAELRQTAGVTLQALVRSATLQFDPAISAQVEANTSAGRAARSESWDRDYAAFKRGEQLSLPYFAERATDAKKQAALTDAYARYRRGELSAAALPDLADIYPDDPQVRAEIGLQTEPGASPAETLIQACGACHNDALDQTISRARFSIALSRMARDELDLAIARIERPAESEDVMPPHGMRQLDTQGRARLLLYLKGNQRSAQDDALLESAARLGMAK
jgi:hypothetical protein